MSRELPARFGIAPHAARALVRFYIGLGVAFVLVSIALMVTGVGAATGVTFLFMTCLLVGFGLYNRSLMAAAQVLHKSFNAASFGHLKDAVELLDYAEENFHLGSVRRAI